MRHSRCSLVTLDSRVHSGVFPHRATWHKEGTGWKREHSFQEVDLSQGQFWSRGDSVMSGGTFDCHDGVGVLLVSSR